MRRDQGKDRLPSLLLASGIRPTRQRLALAALLFDGSKKHMTAEQVHALTHRSRARVSLATVYNSLHQFTAAGLLREVPVGHNRSVFDTNTEAHCHTFDEVTDHLRDIPSSAIRLSGLLTSALFMAILSQCSFGTK